MIDKFEETVQEHRGEKVSNAPPPPYTESPPKGRRGGPRHNSDTSYPLSIEYAKRERNVRRASLHWFLVEIIAVTFSTDCRRLKATLLKTDPRWAPLALIEDSSSIIDRKRRELLTELSALVQNLEEKITGNRWLLVHKQDKDLIEKLILEPVDDLDLNLDYVLEVFGRYKRVEGCRRPESTLVDYWMSSSLRRIVVVPKEDVLLAVERWIHGPGQGIEGPENKPQDE
ncbi:hypothetical protein N0V90_002017 [Kalmusia sp. IMI 367209]|nr:hypothetical protein N0V90_002017 [Kalmusia sp. IMI 367209]